MHCKDSAFKAGSRDFKFLWFLSLLCLNCLTVSLEKLLWKVGTFMVCLNMYSSAQLWCWNSKTWLKGQKNSLFLATMQSTAAYTVWLVYKGRNFLWSSLCCEGGRRGDLVWLSHHSRLLGNKFPLEGCGSKLMSQCKGSTNWRYFSLLEIHKEKGG